MITFYVSICILYIISVTGNFCTITKLPIDRNIVYTLNPLPGLSRKLHSKAAKANHVNYIYDILYCMSPVTESKIDQNYFDDDHFCSRLCDRGYRVHILCSPINLLDHTSLDIPDIYTDMRQLTKVFYKLNINPKNTVVVANEVNVPPLLSSLNDLLSPNSINPVDLAAVVLIDPPPLLTLHTATGRRNLIKNKYHEQLRFLYLGLEKKRKKELARIQQLKAIEQGNRKMTGLYSTPMSAQSINRLSAEPVRGGGGGDSRRSTRSSSSGSSSSMIGEEFDPYNPPISALYMYNDYTMSETTEIDPTLTADTTTTTTSTPTSNSSANTSVQSSDVRLNGITPRNDDINSSTIHEDDTDATLSDMGTIEDQTKVADRLLGTRIPTRAWEIGKKLKDRILVLSSIPDMPYTLSTTTTTTTTATTTTPNNSFIAAAAAAVRDSQETDTQDNRGRQAVEEEKEDPKKNIYAEYDKLYLNDSNDLSRSSGEDEMINTYKIHDEIDKIFNVIENNYNQNHADVIDRVIDNARNSHINSIGDTYTTYTTENEIQNWLNQDESWSYSAAVDIARQYMNEPVIKIGKLRSQEEEEEEEDSDIDSYLDDDFSQIYTDRDDSFSNDEEDDDDDITPYNSNNYYNVNYENTDNPLSADKIYDFESYVFKTTNMTTTTTTTTTTWMDSIPSQSPDINDINKENDIGMSSNLNNMNSGGHDNDNKYDTNTEEEDTYVKQFNTKRNKVFQSTAWLFDPSSSSSPTTITTTSTTSDSTTDISSIDSSSSSSSSSSSDSSSSSSTSSMTSSLKDNNTNRYHYITRNKAKKSSYEFIESFTKKYYIYDNDNNNDDNNADVSTNKAKSDQGSSSTKSIITINSNNTNDNSYLSMTENNSKSTSTSTKKEEKEDNQNKNKNKNKNVNTKNKYLSDSNKHFTPEILSTLKIKQDEMDWSEEYIKKHQDIADVISDWLDMLPVFKLI